MLAKAVELANTHGWFLCRQFENQANADVHSRTTAREILADFADERLDYFVTGFGTGGTLKGVARDAEGRRGPARGSIAAEPDNSPVLGSSIPQPRNAAGSPSGSHPRFRPHLMQGWAPDFISTLTEEAVAAGFVDEIVPVAGADALRLARELARQEGIFVGTSSGATLAAALEVARRAPPGANIVCMLPDTGERYLSTPLFEGIGEEMTAEEWAVSRSTPSCRFDLPAAPAPAPAVVEKPAAVDPDAARLVTKIVDRRTGGDVRARVVRVLLVGAQAVHASWASPIAASMWTRWSTRRKTWAAVSAPCSRIAPARRPCRRSSSAASTSAAPRTLFDAWRNGNVQQRLNENGVSYDRDANLDPYSLLPKWLQPRKSA